MRACSAVIPQQVWSQELSDTFRGRRRTQLNATVPDTSARGPAPAAARLNCSHAGRALEGRSRVVATGNGELCVPLATALTR